MEKSKWKRSTEWAETREECLSFEIQFSNLSCEENFCCFQGFSVADVRNIFQENAKAGETSTKCEDRVEHIYPKSVSQTGYTLFDQLSSFRIENSSKQARFRKPATFDTNRIVYKKKLQWYWYNKVDKKTFNHLGVQYFNPGGATVVYYNYYPINLLGPLKELLEKWLSQSKAERKYMFRDIEIAFQKRFAGKLKKSQPTDLAKSLKLKICVIRKTVMTALHQFKSLYFKKNQLVDLQEHMER